MSTPQCPKCKAALTDDYGMVTCPSCGTVVFIDMDGMAHIGEETRQKPSDARLTVTRTAEEASDGEEDDVRLHKGLPKLGPSSASFLVISVKAVILECAHDQLFFVLLQEERRHRRG